MINEKQLAMFENCLGVEGLKMCNSLSFAHEETRTVSTILTKMDLQIVGELNETYERYIFNLINQHSDESIDEYVTELKHLSKSCNFCGCLCDSLLRDKLVMGNVDKETRNVTPNEKADIRIVCRHLSCLRSFYVTNCSYS